MFPVRKPEHHITFCDFYRAPPVSSRNRWCSAALYLPIPRHTARMAGNLAYSCVNIRVPPPNEKAAFEAAFLTRQRRGAYPLRFLVAFEFVYTCRRSISPRKCVSTPQRTRTQKPPHRAVFAGPDDRDFSLSRLSARASSRWSELPLPGRQGRRQGRTRARAQPRRP